LTLDKKFVAVLDKNLSIGIAFNTLAHLALIAGRNSENYLGKEKITDASNITHLGFSKYPFIILKSDSQKIKNIVNSAKNDDKVLIIDFPEQAYTEYTDEELVEALSKTKNENLKYYGLALFGNKENIDKYTKNLELWK